MRLPAKLFLPGSISRLRNNPGVQYFLAESLERPGESRVRRRLRQCHDLPFQCVHGPESGYGAGIANVQFSGEASGRQFQASHASQDDSASTSVSDALLRQYADGADYHEVCL